jgi:hypothetical protein
MVNRVRCDKRIAQYRSLSSTLIAASRRIRNSALAPSGSAPVVHRERSPLSPLSWLVWRQPRAMESFPASQRQGTTSLATAFSSFAEDAPLLSRNS